MLIVTVNASLNSNSIKSALDILSRLRLKSLHLNGCKEYHIFNAPEDPENIFIFQIWLTKEDFEAYKNGEDFAKMGNEISPMMTSAPKTAIFDVKSI